MSETRTDEIPHLTVKQLARRWHTTPQAIYNMRHRRKTPPSFKRGRELLFPLAAVEAHEAAGLAADPKAGEVPEMRPPEMRTPAA
jgi:hypothetical protein